MKKTALTYLNADLCVLPAIRAEKRPALKRRWEEYKTQRPTYNEVVAWFSNSHDALCVVAGAVSGNLEMIDFDCKAVFYEPWRQAVDEDAPGLIDKLAIETTQSGGRHVFYRCEMPIAGNLKLAQRKVHGKTETLIETRGEGGLFLCYPTPGYDLIQGDFTALPILTEDERNTLIMAAAKLNQIEPEPVQYQPRQSGWNTYDGRPGDDFNSRTDVREILKAHGWQYLGTDAVNEKWRRPGKDKGGLSATLRKEDQRFYIFSSNAAPFEPSKTYLPFAVYALLDCRGDYEKAARQLSKQGFGKPLEAQTQDDSGVDISGILGQDPKPEPKPVAKTTEPEPTADAKPTKDKADPGLIPDSYFYEVPGFINAYMKHCVGTAPYKRPGMAFCGAMACLSFLTGRKVKSPAGIRPNLYILGVAGSGGGKDWARKINGDIFDFVGASACLGKDFASGEGLEDKLAQNLCMLFQNDEMDSLLQCIKGGQDGRYDRLMSSLLSLYTSSDSVIPMRAKAGMESGTVIRQPHLALFGTATTENFYGAFNERMLTNGLFSRMMIIDMGEKRGRFNQPGDREAIPEKIKDDAKFWMEKATGFDGNLTWENPSPIVVPYSGQAGDILLKFQWRTDEYYEKAKDEVTRVAWTRAGENARKLALLYACSEDAQNPRISEKAAQWAMRFVEHQIKRQLYQVSVYYAESPFHKLCLKIIDRVRKAPGQKLSRGKLLRAMHIKAREMDELEDTLEQMGYVEIVQEFTAKRPTTIYKYKGHE